MHFNQRFSAGRLGLLLVVIAVTVSGCKLVPPGASQGKFVASQGVKDMFDDPDVDVIVDNGDRIRCERQKRLGTHRHTKVCMTIAEWDERKRRQRELQQKNMMGVCGASPSGGSYMDGNVTGALLPSNCGDSINRGN